VSAHSVELNVRRATAFRGEDAARSPLKKMPLLWPPRDRASKTGDFCDAKITTPEKKLQLKTL